MTVAAEVEKIPAAIYEYASVLGVRIWQAGTPHDRWRLGGRLYAADIAGKLVAVFDTPLEIKEWLSTRK